MHLFPIRFLKETMEIYDFITISEDLYSALATEVTSDRMEMLNVWLIEVFEGSLDFLEYIYDQHKRATVMNTKSSTHQALQIDPNLLQPSNDL